MSKAAHIGVAAVFAAFAVASLIGIAGSAPEASPAIATSCDTGFCFVSIF